MTEQGKGEVKSTDLHVFQSGFNYSQDGPGNRLVYHLQGCDLRCPWCSNPEGLPAHGGEPRTPEDLIDEVRRSRMMFFDGGGVTLTGGEVTMQFDAVKAFLSALKAEGVHTCIETNGLHPRLPELFPVLDLLIMDVKHHDPEKHRIATGLPNDAVFRNIAAALNAGQATALRIPLIGGFNSSEEDAVRFAARLTELRVPGRMTVEILPYHEYGKSKYAKLGLPYTMDDTAKVTEEAVRRFALVLADAGIEIIRT